MSPLIKRVQFFYNQNLLCLMDFIQTHEKMHLYALDYDSIFHVIKTLKSPIVMASNIFVRKCK
jgi:hypothetical protein